MGVAGAPPGPKVDLNIETGVIELELPDFAR